MLQRLSLSAEEKRKTRQSDLSQVLSPVCGDYVVRILFFRQTDFGKFPAVDPRHACMVWKTIQEDYVLPSFIRFQMVSFQESENKLLPTQANLGRIMRIMEMNV